MAEKLIERVDQALEGLLSKAECRSLQYHAEKRMGIIPIVLPIFVVGQFHVIAMLEDAGVVTGFGAVLYVLPALICFDVVVVILTIRWRNRTVFLRMMSRLHQLDIRPHFCLNCEYDLKGSVADHCPECGVALAPVDAGLDRRV